MKDFKWIIVGGGIHGVHMAIRLLEAGLTSIKELCIIDPHDELLARWNKNTRTTGMTHLRSPSVHNLSPGAHDLERFAGKRRSRSPDAFRFPYNRPALSLFANHNTALIEKYDLGHAHLKTLVSKIEPDESRVILIAKNGEKLSASNVILSLGVSDLASWPSWAPKGRRNIQHIFASQEILPASESERILVVKKKSLQCKFLSEWRERAIVLL